MLSQNNMPSTPNNSKWMWSGHCCFTGITLASHHIENHISLFWYLIFDKWKLHSILMSLILRAYFFAIYISSFVYWSFISFAQSVFFLHHEWFHFIIHFNYRTFLPPFLIFTKLSYWPITYLPYLWPLTFPLILLPARPVSFLSFWSNSWRVKVAFYE